MAVFLNCSCNAGPLVTHNSIWWPTRSWNMSFKNDIFQHLIKYPSSVSLNLLCSKSQSMKKLYLVSRSNKILDFFIELYPFSPNKLDMNCLTVIFLNFIYFLSFMFQNWHSKRISYFLKVLVTEKDLQVFVLGRVSVVKKHCNSVPQHSGWESLT